MSPREPIFIVGVQRSGTTLLSAMLSAHSKLSCGPETHFFRRLSQINPGQLVEPVTWPEKAKDFVLSITHTNFSNSARTPLVEKYQLSEDEISCYLEAHSPAVNTILSSITEQYMQRMGKQRWIEKTPDHILYLELIRKYFPSSPIIRIIRDPRAVAHSLTKVPWGAESFLHALLTWEKLDLASDGFFSSDLSCYTIYFEKLLASPYTELRSLCDFLDEGFEEQMLDTGFSGKQLNSRNVEWKRKASQPLDPSRTQAWKSELTPFEKKMAEAMIGDRIKAHNYELFEQFELVGEFIPQKNLAAKYQKELGDLLGSNTRYWKEEKGERTKVKVYLGDPSADGWIRKNFFTSILDTVLISFHVLKDKLNKNTVYWVTNQKEDFWSGYKSLVVKKIIAPNRVSQKP